MVPSQWWWAHATEEKWTLSKIWCYEGPWRASATTMHWYRKRMRKMMNRMMMMTMPEAAVVMVVWGSSWGRMRASSWWIMRQQLGIVWVFCMLLKIFVCSVFTVDGVKKSTPVYKFIYMYCMQIYIPLWALNAKKYLSSKHQYNKTDQWKHILSHHNPPWHPKVIYCHGPVKKKKINKKLYILH